MWVKSENTDQVMPAYDDKEVMSILSVSGGEEKKEGVNCPHCKTVLDKINYEGTPIFKCSFCEGVFVEDHHT